MTAAMRTFAVAAGPRIPRIAVVRGGRIVDEHLIRDASRITIGTAESALIVVPGASSLPASFELLERVGDRYWLRVTDEMVGRVTVANGVRSIADLREGAHAVPGGFRIALSEDARGKIVVGDTTFLFQLVPRPPISPRPQLPLGVTTGSLQLDWGLTIIVAFSFLLHFGIAGAMYSDWLDPVVAADRTVAGIVDDLARLQKPAPEIAPPPEPRVVDESPDVAPLTRPVPQDTRRSPKEESLPTSPTPRRVSDNDAAALAARASRMEVDWIAARSNGPAVQRTLDRTAVPIVDLTPAAERNVGVTHENPDGLKVATGGPIEGTRSSSSLPAIAGQTRRLAQEHAGNELATSGPRLTVDTPPTGSGGTLSDADRVIATLRPRFRKCY
jgi:hypothetical protein